MKSVLKKLFSSLNILNQSINIQLNIKQEQHIIANRESMKARSKKFAHKLKKIKTDKNERVSRCVGCDF